jgi:hypothetical protein
MLKNVKVEASPSVERKLLAPPFHGIWSLGIFSISSLGAIREIDFVLGSGVPTKTP